LPAALLDEVLLRLDAHSLRSVAATCAPLRALASSLAPGLHVRLHAHQRAALSWMRGREAAGAAAADARWRPLAPGVWAHCASGALRRGAPPPLPQPRGGLLCGASLCGHSATGSRHIRADEPGLGKSVTILALCCATRGLCAAAPARVRAAGRDADGAEWYAPPRGEEAAEAGGGGRGRRASADASRALGHFSGLFSPPPRRRSAAAVAGGGEAPPDAVYLSSATLLLCPPILLAHWAEQLAPAVAAGALRVASAAPPPPAAARAGVTHLARPEALHPARLAAAADVVLLPFTRLAGALGAGGSLLRVRWLRVVLDEGHVLGASLALSCRGAVAAALLAERRWVVTGTPTPALLLRAGGQLAHLRPLMAWVGCGGAAASERDWAAAVQRPLEGRGAGAAGACARAAAAHQLAGLLRPLAVRTRKEDIRLPKLRRATALLPFTPPHAAAYNALVAHVRRSILLADWSDPGHEQSLLGARQAQAARLVRCSAPVYLCAV